MSASRRTRMNARRRLCISPARARARARAATQVLAEAMRVLRPGGEVVLSFSNRMFATKAFALWRATNDVGRVWIAAALLHYAGFEAVDARDLSPAKGRSDPLYIVRARRPPSEQEGVGGGARAEL